MERRRGKRHELPCARQSFDSAIHSLLLHRSYGLGTLVGLEEMPFWVRKIKG